MKLILLYGPPAVGKLTIANKLSKITGISVFHNHMIINPLRDIFGMESPIRAKLEYEFRFRIVEEAVENNKDLVMTGVIAMNNYKKLYKMVIDEVESHGGQLFLVRLTAPKEVLRERVVGEDRKKRDKIHTIESWDSFALSYPEMYDTYAEKEHLTIDTSKLTPEKAAQEIASYYHLA
jgi:deoxyadenosine/deoxycytidine kinase